MRRNWSREPVRMENICSYSFGITDVSGNGTGSCRASVFIPWAISSTSEEFYLAHSFGSSRAKDWLQLSSADSLMTDGTDGGIAPQFWEEARSEMYPDELQRVKMDLHRDEKRVRYLTLLPFNEKIHFSPKDTALMSKDITIQLRTHLSHGVCYFYSHNINHIYQSHNCHIVSHIDKDSTLNKITKWEGNRYICYLWASLMWVPSQALHMTSCC